MPLWNYLAIICPYSLAFICPVSCVPYVANFSGLSFFITFLYYLACIGPVSCVPNVASFSGLSFFIVPSVISNFFVLCLVYPVLPFLWIVLFYFPFGIISHVFVLCLVYPMLRVSLDCPFLLAPSVFCNIYLSYVLCTLCCQFLWIVLFYLPFGILQHLFVLCTLCCAFLWIVLFF